MLNVEIRNSLANILRQNGKAIAQDPVSLQTMLRSEAAQYPREIGMIVNAARAGIPKDIEDAGNAINDLRPRMVEKLQTEQAFPQDVAEWVVETWISALSFADSAPSPAPAPVAPAPVAPAPVTPVAPVAQPAPVAQAPMPQQNPYGQAPPANPQYQQYNQFASPQKNSGKTIAIVVCAVIVLAGLAVGGYFLFRGKGTTPGPVAGTTSGTTGGSPDPQQLFNTTGGNTTGGATGGATGGSPGTTGGGTGTTGGGPGTTGGSPGTDTGGANGGGTGGDTNGGGNTGGGPGQQAITGSYHSEFDPADQGAGTSGTLTLNADMTFDWQMSTTGTSLEATGHMANGGNQIVLNIEKAMVNGKEGDANAWKMSLVPVDQGKFLFQGTLADKLAEKNVKLYFVK